MLPTDCWQTAGTHARTEERCLCATPGFATSSSTSCVTGFPTMVQVSHISSYSCYTFKSLHKKTKNMPWIFWKGLQYFLLGIWSTCKPQYIFKINKAEFFLYIQPTIKSKAFVTCLTLLGLMGSPKSIAREKEALERVCAMSKILQLIGFGSRQRFRKIIELSM